MTEEEAHHPIRVLIAEDNDLVALTPPDGQGPGFARPRSGARQRVLEAAKGAGTLRART